MNADLRSLGQTEIASAQAFATFTVEAERAIRPLHNERLGRATHSGESLIVVLERWRGNEDDRGLRFVELHTVAVNAMEAAWVVKSDTFMKVPTGPLTSRKGLGPQ